jgi:Raf kinase inhibitor-like YbhB/YbcL family protein
VQSTAFGDGDTVPRRYTADGENVSPALGWSEPPPHTKSIVLICEDPDAPSGLFVHWLAWNIDPDRRELSEAVSKLSPDLVQGTNGFGDTGYGGPSPPPGTPHRYVFRVLALDYRPELPPGAKRAALDRAIEAHVLAEGKLVGKYGR